MFDRNDHDLMQLIRPELDRLKRRAIGLTTVAESRAAVPALWMVADRLFPSSSALSGAPLRSLLAEAARVSEPTIRGLASRDLLGLEARTATKSLEVRRENAGEHFGVRASTFRQGQQYERAVLDELAARIADLNARRHQPQRKQAELRFVERPEYCEHLSRLESEGHLLVVVWGEPGVGKTSLVKDHLTSAGGRAALWLRFGAQRELNEDLFFALRDAGIDTVGMSLDERLLRMKDLLMKGGIQAVVLDDVHDREEVSTVMDMESDPATKTFIISRLRLQVPGAAELRVGPLESAESTALCNSLGLSHETEDLMSLHNAMGGRALAIVQAARFLARSPTTTIQGLVSSVSAHAATTLDHVAIALQANTNLATLYRLMVEEISEDPAVLASLDAIVLLSDQGAIPDEIIRIYAIHVVGDETQYEAALVRLADLGLVETVWRPMRLGAEDDLVPQIGMPLLTWQIFRELRGQQARKVMTGFLRAILRASVDPQTAAEVLASGSRHALVVGLLATEFRIATRVASEEVENADLDLYLLLSSTVWLRIHGSRDRDTKPLEVEFVEVQESGIYATTWEGVRRTLQDADVRSLARFGERYLELLEEWHSEP